MVFKASQSTLCDVIAGVTTDTSAVGIGKFGATCFGIRYSSAVDSNFMFCSKVGNSTWAANDASNYSLSTGVAVDTNYHTFRMRSVTAGVVEMKLDAGAWTAVTMVSASGNFIPYFYVSSRTSATKAMLVDYFSCVQTGVSR